MKAGVTTSVFAHMALLAWGVVSVAAPTPLSVPDVEALPIDIVPIEEITKSVKGDRKADPAKKPAPKQTIKPPTPRPAVNIGDTDNDQKAEAPEKAKAPPVERTEAPAPKPSPKVAGKPKPVPTPKLARKPKPKTDLAMLIEKSETQETEEPVEETFQKLPQRVAAPKKRPAKPDPEAAETNKRKKEEEIAAAARKKAEAKKQSDAKKKATVNKAKSNAGGAKRSKDKAALGTKKTNSSGKLAQSEIDALRGRLEGCWSVGDLTGHPDADKMRAKVTFKLTRAGDIDGRVKVRVTGTDRSTRSVLAVRVRAAVSDCAPYTLPAEKYDTWSEVVVNFSLQDML